MYLRTNFVRRIIKAHQLRATVRVELETLAIRGIVYRVTVDRLHVTGVLNAP